MKSIKEFTDLGFQAPKLNYMIKKLVDLCCCEKINGVQKEEILRINRKFMSQKIILAPQRSFLNNIYIEKVLQSKKNNNNLNLENKENHIGLKMFNELNKISNEKKILQ